QQADNLEPGTGQDTVQCGKLENDEDHVSYAALTTSLTVDLRAGRVSGAEVGVDRVQASCYITGSAGADMMIGSNGPDHMGGGPGNDIMVGDPAGDVSHDFLQGDAGNDLIFGGDQARDN